MNFYKDYFQDSISGDPTNDIEYFFFYLLVSVTLEASGVKWVWGVVRDNGVVTT